jgi:hypothetical protein
LGDSDEDAETHLLAMLEESVNALFPEIFDKIHIWYGYMK